ncbi:hypothetical protein DIS24_g3819 [Lasiodiplodia hormozganensis]|uniref:Uncharacterized protein n=1 Tax=Lasiodiplodia hormozganensis TaxID=869390 RepID=A0AA39YVS2_9PEZI|nr:hypothetical protein DIS24_g3819 [Lasiodiplodia hormozganensis]
MTQPYDMSTLFLDRLDLDDESIGSELDAVMDTYISFYNLACASIWAGELENGMEICRELLDHDDLPLLIRARASIDLAWTEPHWQDVDRHFHNAEVAYRRMCELVEPARLNEKWGQVIFYLHELEPEIAHYRLEAEEEEDEPEGP